MPLNQLIKARKRISSIAIFTSTICGCIAAQEVLPPKALSTPSMLEFRWEDTGNYKKLYYYQSSQDKRDRSTYYLVLKPRNRQTAILKLSISVPEHFNSTIKTKKLSLCEVQVGGMTEKTKCLKEVPAVFEVNEDMTKIEVFPNQPIPVNKKGYAVVMKVFNPTRSGMFQFNATSLSPGDLPVSRYLGSWSIDIR